MQEKGSQNIGGIPQTAESNSRREFEGGVRDLLIAVFEEIYKLKREMRKVNFALRTVSELKDRPEEKFGGETTRSKRLRGN